MGAQDETGLQKLLNGNRGTVATIDHHAWNQPHHAGDLDAMLWGIEKDPLLRQTITAVLILDQAPDQEVLLERLERCSRSLPSFRHRLVQPPLRLSTPRWLVDPNFDLSYHVRWIGAPNEGSLAGVLAFAASRRCLVSTGIARFGQSPWLKLAFALIMKHDDFVLSNVNAGDSAFYLAGAKVVHIFPFGPPCGHRRQYHVAGYQHKALIGIAVDGAAVARSTEGEGPQLRGLCSDARALVIP